ncbi:Integrase catalytic domain-containing protein [Citrus sinensis]|uniref:Integrase catalytic domain-containing protein n=1 Tax=Citrus sinensis TaxID=2711 RepID=A0ACB8JVM0_CITSI|nr:Integrase catalytic domain-containing protein [Citrus sinensis]
MAHPKVDLEKFTGKNDFNIWKVKMEALLITQGLGDALEPVTKKEGIEASSSLTPQQASDIDKRARSTIILSLGDSVIREVAKEKTVADLWAKLETIYMTKSLANRLHIKKMMFTLKMAAESSLDDHIDEFNRVCDTLETIDESLSDESKALLLISSLPQSYSNFVDALIIKLESGELKILDGSTLVMKGTRKNEVYILDMESVTRVSNAIETTDIDKTTLWHLRLGHLSIKGLKELNKQGVLGNVKIGELVFCEECILDMWGPSQVPSLGGNRYFMTMIDDYSRRVWVFCANEGIARHRIVRLTPQQNGLAERMNMTLMDKVRCMMIQSQLPKGLWAETLLTACLLVNLSPSAAIDFKTPLEMWSGTWDVIFNEETMLKEKPQEKSVEPQAKTQENIQFEVEHPNLKSSQEAADSDGDEDDSSGNTEPQSQQHTQTQLRDYHLVRDKERRQIRPPQRYGYADLIAYTLTASHEIDEDEPTSYREAMKSSYKSEWQRAMED